MYTVFFGASPEKTTAGAKGEKTFTVQCVTVVKESRRGGVGVGAVVQAAHKGSSPPRYTMGRVS